MFVYYITGFVLVSFPDQEQQEKQLLEDPSEFIKTYRDALIADIGAASSTLQRLTLEEDQTDLAKKLQEARSPRNLRFVLAAAGS